MLLIFLFVSIKIFPKQEKFLFLSALILSAAILNFEFFYHGLLREELGSIIDVYEPKAIFFQTIFFTTLFLVIPLMNTLLNFQFFKNFFLFCCLFGCLIPGVQIIFKILSEETNVLRSSELNSHADAKQGISILNENIYFVVLDGYASEKTFSRMSVDNDYFYDYLQENDFNMLGDKAAYDMTYLSLAGIFNLTYPVIEGDTRYTSRDSFYPLLLLKEDEPPLIRELSNLNYSFILFGNTWSGCYPKHIQCGFLPEGLISNESFVLFRKTALQYFFETFRNYQYDAISNFINSNDEIIEKNSNFSFIHQLSPHDPYLLEDCKTLTKNLSALDYITTVKCVNKKVMQLVSTLNRKDPSGIIIIQSDHGPDTTSSWLPGYDTPDDIHIDNRVGIINAIKSPEECGKWLKDDMGPINTTRFILGCIRQDEPSYIEEKTFIGSYENDKDFGLIKRHINK